MPVTTRSSRSSASSTATLSSRTLSDATFHSVRPPHRHPSVQTITDSEDDHGTAEPDPEPKAQHKRTRAARPSKSTRADKTSYNVPHSEPPKCKYCRKTARQAVDASSFWLWKTHLLHIPLLILYFCGGASGPTDAQFAIVLMAVAFLIWVVVVLAFQNCCLKLSLCWQSCWLVLTQLAVVVLLLALACAVIMWEKDRQQVVAIEFRRRVDHYGHRRAFY